MVYRAFPLARNTILVRFENLADLFDGADQSVKYVDVESFAKDFYRDANKNDRISMGTIKIEEFSLSNNQPITEI